MERQEEKTIFEKVAEWLDGNTGMSGGGGKETIGSIIKSQEDLMTLIPYAFHPIGDSEGGGIPKDVVNAKRIREKPTNLSTPIMTILLSTPAAMNARANETRSHVWHVMGAASSGKTVNMTNLGKLTLGLYVLTVLGHDRGVDDDRMAQLVGEIARVSVKPLQEESGINVDWHKQGNEFVRQAHELSRSKNAPQLPSLEKLPDFDQIRGMLDEVAKVPKALVSNTVEILGLNLQGVFVGNDAFTNANQSDPAPYVNILSGLGDGDLNVYLGLFTHNFDDAFYESFLKTFGGNREGIFSRRGLWFNVGNLEPELLEKLRQMDGKAAFEFAQESFGDWIYNQFRTWRPGEQGDIRGEVALPELEIDISDDLERIDKDHRLTAGEKKGFKEVFQSIERQISDDIKAGITSLNDEDLDSRWKTAVSQIEEKADGFSPTRRGKRSQAFGDQKEEQKLAYMEQYKKALGVTPDQERESLGEERTGWDKKSREQLHLVENHIQASRNTPRYVRNVLKQYVSFRDYLNKISDGQADEAIKKVLGDNFESNLIYGKNGKLTFDPAPLLTLALHTELVKSKKKEVDKNIAASGGNVSKEQRQAMYDKATEGIYDEVQTLVNKYQDLRRNLVEVMGFNSSRSMSYVPKYDSRQIYELAELEGEDRHKVLNRMAEIVQQVTQEEKDKHPQERTRLGDVRDAMVSEGVEKIMKIFKDNLGGYGSQLRKFLDYWSGAQEIGQGTATMFTQSLNNSSLCRSISRGKKVEEGDIPFRLGDEEFVFKKESFLQQRGMRQFDELMNAIDNFVGNKNEAKRLKRDIIFGLFGVTPMSNVLATAYDAQTTSDWELKDLEQVLGHQRYQLRKWDKPDDVNDTDIEQMANLVRHISRTSDAVSAQTTSFDEKFAEQYKNAQGNDEIFDEARNNALSNAEKLLLALSNDDIFNKIRENIKESEDMEHRGVALNVLSSLHTLAHKDDGFQPGEIDQQTQERIRNVLKDRYCGDQNKRVEHSQRLVDSLIGNE